MRGALADLPAAGYSLRIIPADAGSTGPAPISRVSMWDHPRGCGEHNSWMSCSKSVSGSSPRMRGAQRTDRLRPFSHGIIPADAGSTRPLQVIRDAIKDHPRGCGEHQQAGQRPVLHAGSSPRMRGALLWMVVGTNCTRIIPADAGSTRSRSSASSPGGDHPRGCGEHRLASPSFAVLFGSSPRMRGALGVGKVKADIARIIPADAGSTLCF